MLTTMGGVRLDNELLAVLSVGGPVGLVVYRAWVQRDWPAATKTAGLVGALARAVVGGKEA